MATDSLMSLKSIQMKFLREKQQMQPTFENLVVDSLHADPERVTSCMPFFCNRYLVSILPVQSSCSQNVFDASSRYKVLLTTTKKALDKYSNKISIKGGSFIG
jgi:hypothetical protein